MGDVKLKMKINHDSLFKWLITLFYREFFKHYFPDREIGAVAFLDKEFVQKFKGLQESLRGDLLVMMRMMVDGKWQSVVVCVEHKSQRTDPSKQMMRYASYAWLFKELPVWGIVFFTDDAQWRKPVPDHCWFGWSDKGDKFLYQYDIIKVNREKSATLLAEKSLFTSLLALKANTEGVDRADIIRAVFRHAHHMGNRLKDDHKLLIHYFVKAYSNVAPETVKHIKKETEMTFVATTISEHFVNIGEERGLEKGREEGLEKGIQALQDLLDRGLITDEVYRTGVASLKKEKPSTAT